jgi:DNA primase
MKAQPLSAEELNHTFDLLPIVERDVQLKRAGSWYIGPCPFCGGTDRFNLHHTQDGWKWFCRHCGEGRYQDATAYIMRREQVTFPQALERMFGEKPDWQVLNQRVREIRQASEERQPPPAWQQRGYAFVEECRQNLWKPVGAKALDYLRGRGLTDITLVKYEVGFNPEDRFDELSDWGLDGDGTVRIERGITLPTIGFGGLYAIKIRRPLAPGSKERKYVQVRGSRVGLFGWSNMPGAWLALVTEGEFDCMILDQEAGDLAGVCTLGSATDSPMGISPDLMRWCYQAAHVLVVFDNDEAGAAGALSFREHLPNVRIVTLPDLWKDINEAFLGGLDLGDWLAREAERLGVVVPEEAGIAEAAV